jgi:hypothetical protein
VGGQVDRGAARDLCGEAAGSIEKIRWPSVRMIRQPPTYVPAAIARPDETITQVRM